VSMFVTNVPEVITKAVSSPAVINSVSSSVKSVTLTEDNSSAIVWSVASGACDWISSVIASNVKELLSDASISLTATLDMSPKDELSGGVEVTWEATLLATDSSMNISISYWTTPLSSMSVTVTVEPGGNTPSDSSVFLIRFWNTFLASSCCARVRVDVSKFVLKYPVVVT